MTKAGRLVTTLPSGSPSPDQREMLLSSLQASSSLFGVQHTAVTICLSGGGVRWSG